jgi:transcriptional regulator with XRE-family HTH domain
VSEDEFFEDDYMDDDGEDRSKNSRRNTFSAWESLLKGGAGLAGQVISRATGQSKNLLEMTMKAPEYLELMGKAGRRLKDLREVSKLTVEDLAKAIDLDNPDLLRAVEEGRSPITLDILLRLASFYSRNDPLSFVLSFSKEYAPWLWYVLRVTGMEKILITVERELKFINIYRSRDMARELSDEDFDRVLGFTRKSFDTALEFIADVDSSRNDHKKESSPEQAPEPDSQP